MMEADENSVNSEFRNYWNLALVSVDRQLVAAAWSCANKGFAQNVSPSNTRKIRDHLKPSKPVVPSPVGARSARGHKIDPDKPLFQQSLRWLQDEIRALLPRSISDRDLADILSVLDFTASQMGIHFGTVTQGWDRLVYVKHQLLLPDPSLLARSSWLVALLVDFERSLRDAICIAVECLGRLEEIKNATKQVIAEQNIRLELGNILHHDNTHSAAAHAISQSMAEGVIKTLRVAMCFAQHLGIRNFEGDCFSRGFHIELEDLGANSNDIISRLADLRHVLLHNPPAVRNAPSHDSTSANIELFERWDFEKLQVIAQFLYSYSIQYTLAVMDVMSKTLVANSAMEELAKIARHKAASELHFGTLLLLKEQLWWLAWALSDYVRVNYEGRDGLMLQLNAAFAQSKIGKPEDWRIGASKIDVKKKAPRYQLLKKSILGEWNGIESTIVKAIEERDMTLAELASWPALESLRMREEYNNAISRFGSEQ